MSRSAAPNGGAIILCADDFAIGEGVSASIEELARAGRLSATSAIVTTSHWAGHAARLRRLRDRLAVGLHIDLTHGRPLGAMPRLAPGGRFPPIGAVTRAAVLGRIDRAEIEAEVARQLGHFEEALGFAPDHVDGHQHVHALPGIRRAVLAMLARRFPNGGPLFRDPSDLRGAAAAKGGAAAKALAVAMLSRGFGGAARRAGFAVSDRFAGFSAFDRRRPFAEELAAALRVKGRRAIVMCHPGRPEAEPEPGVADPISARRGDELAALREAPGLAASIWHPARAADGAAFVWDSGGEA